LARIDAAVGDQLLDLARAHDVPIYWRCGQGTCGTCKVRVLHTRQPCQLLITRKEHNVLLRAGLLERAADDGVTVDDLPTSWRLACHVYLTEQDITIVVPVPGG